jgi:hypothetical protein
MEHVTGESEINGSMSDRKFRLGTYDVMGARQKPGHVIDGERVDYFGHLGHLGDLGLLGNQHVENT